MSNVIYDTNGNIVNSIDQSPEMIVDSAGAPINPSTSALQSAANADISSINTKTPALGQALAAASVPVVLTTAQLATLTPPTTVTVVQPTGASLHTVIDNASIAVTGTFFQATQPVSIASPVAVTGPLTDAQLRASPITITGSITTSNPANGITGSTAPANATQVAGSDGTNLRALKVSTLGVLSVDGSAVTQPVSIAAPVAVTGTFFQATQPVSAASLPLPTGASTSALQTTGNNSLASIDSKLTSPLAVTGPLTDAQLRASSVNVAITNLTSPLPVTGSVTTTASATTTGAGGAISVTSTPTAVRAGGSNLANRRNLTFYNNSATAGNILYWSYDPAVTAATGIPVPRQTQVSIDVGPAVTVYLVAASGSHNVRVMELA